MLTWLNCFTPDRFGMEPASKNERSDYERDYDRIIFSSAFRRLQNKTQVFPLPEHVFVHNRLTHSLEVVSVGRSLGKMVGAKLAEKSEIKDNAEAVNFYRNELKHVISAACLAHDLGNPAFGHSGEEAISKYFKDKEKDTAFKGQFTDAQWEDLIRFEGNANALRILTRKFNGRLAGGFRLTYPTLASILKYPCASTARNKSKGKHRSKYGYFQSDESTFKDVVQKLHFIKDQEEPLSYYRHPFVYLVEAADDICYNIIDFEDAHRLGILTFVEIKEIFMELLASDPMENMDRVAKNLENLSEDHNESVAYLRAKAINLLVSKCTEVFMTQTDAIISGTFNGALLDHLDAQKEVLTKISKISVKRIYNHESVLKIELAGFKIMSGLIEDLVEAALTAKEDRANRHKKILSLMPVQYQFNESDAPYEKIMCLLDYVSGMTDNFALELYRNLRGISVPRI